MKFNITRFIRNSFNQIRNNCVNYPIEVIMTAIAGIFLIWYLKDITDHLRYVFALSVPAVLSFNQLSIDKEYRKIYWIGSIVAIGLLSLVPWERWLGENGKISYFLALCILLWSIYFFTGKEKENTPFAEKVFHFFVSLFLGGLFTAIVAGLFELIYYTCHLLFGISHNLIPSDYKVYFWFFLVFPQFFLFQYGNKELKTPWLHTVINMLLTPAAIIYTVILYVYFFKILIEASFPQGMIAYMVLFYIGISIFLQMNYLFVSKKNKIYDWFYEKLNYLCIFPLIMFFLAAYKRVAAYGFTEDRFYLFAVGIFYLSYILLFIFPKTRKFKLLLPIFMLIVIVSTFTPYFNAYQLSIRSQINRVENILVKNELLDDEGLIKSKENLEPILYNEHRSLTSALYYLADRGINQKDFTAFSKLDDYSIYDLGQVIPYYFDEESKKENDFNKYIYYSEKKHDISGYDSLFFVNSTHHFSFNNYLLQSEGDSLFLYKQIDDGVILENDDVLFDDSVEMPVDSLVFSLNISDILTQKAKELNIDIYFFKEIVDTLSISKKEKLFSFEKDEFKFILSNFDYHIPQQTNKLEITYFSIEAICLKTKNTH